MRIEPELLYEIQRVTERAAVLTSLAELEELASCFSSREAALAESVFLCFFTLQNKITAVLLITESPYLFLHDSILRLFFTVVTYVSSPLLAKARSARLYSAGDHGYINKGRFLAAVKKYAAELPEGESLTFLSLDAKTLIAAIRALHSDIDGYRVLQDITAVIGTLLADSPVFVATRKKKVLTVTRSGQFDSALLVHQISLMMRKFFQENEETSQIEITENSLPTGDIPDDVVNTFL